MFIRLFVYRLRILLKNRSLIFWTFAFPIVLGLLFNLAFGNMDEVGKLERSTVGVVSYDEERTNQFESVLGEFKQDNRTIYKSKRMSQNKAKTELAEDKISGFYKINSSGIRLYVSKNGTQQTVLKEIMNQYTQEEDKIENLLNKGSIHPSQIESGLIRKDYLQEDDIGKISWKSFYFFTLVGMTIMNGFMWGLRNANDQQANQSSEGIRLSLAPMCKLLISLANMLASFFLFLFQTIIIILFYHFVYQVEFGDKWNYIIILSAIGAFASISLGTLMGNTLTKLTMKQKVSIGNSLSMGLSFLAGMMNSQVIKSWIDDNIPILGRINIVNLISESLYQLYYYRTMQPFYNNLMWLGSFSLLFVLLNYSFERKIQYDHI